MNDLRTKKVYEATLAIACCLVVYICFRKSPVLATGGIIAFAIIYILASRLRTALFFMILFMPLQRSIFHNYGLALSWFPVIALSIVLILHLLRNMDQIGFSEHLPQWLLLFLFGYIIISLWVDASLKYGGPILVSPLKGGGVAHFRYILQTALFFWILSFLVTTRRDLNTVICSLVVTLLFVSIVGFYELLSFATTASTYLQHLYSRFYPQAATATSLTTPTAFQLRSIFVGWVGNFQFGNFLVTSGLITMPYLFATLKNTMARICLVILVVICLCCLYFTHSVGSWVAAAAGMISLRFLFSKRRVHLLMGMSIITILIFVGVYLWPSGLEILPEGPRTKATDLVNLVFRFEYPHSRPIWIRIDLIKAGLQMFSQNPLFGMGFSTYGRYALQSNLAGVYEIVWPYAHNSYILILAELGLVGITLFLILMYTAIKTSISNMQMSRDKSLLYLQTGVLSAIIANLFFLAVYETWMFNLNLWLPLGLTLAIRQVIENEAEKQN